MGKSLYNIAKTSKVNNISIRYNKEKIAFRLSEELEIDSGRIIGEMEQHPVQYGFLNMLAEGLKRKYQDLKLEAEKKWAEAFTEWKSSVDEETNRLYPKETAKAMADQDEDYIEARKAEYKAEQEWGSIAGCLRSFEQRGHMVQSINANLRKEK